MTMMPSIAEAMKSSNSNNNSRNYSSALPMSVSLFVCLKKVHKRGRSNSSANYKSTSVIQDIHAIRITEPLLSFSSSSLLPPLNWISIHGAVLLRQTISQHETDLTSSTSEFGGEDSRGIPSAFKFHKEWQSFSGLLEIEVLKGV